ncbi:MULTISPECIES: AAA family ATPase [unclassified Amycolatopsis]|uniref:AAA family ATPase n=1 Tax=unclassified Amycolatopsis TaxID=2618356 RepID=UPI00287445A0|nr:MULTISPECIES: AAA family ATPase [unclassified Amycolatopsis]MDS0135812.1 AAA family ATPase [Amycolatopsis sp. 505]MDS0145587.1 AAA family ATPase [Amycolatopsis sp. CM201R]
MTSAVLVVLGGLPGTGKSTVARPLARALGAAYLRIDTIEQALVDSGELPARPRAAGYVAGYALARDQLANGVCVVAECVNPLAITRDAWRAVGDRVLEVELVCSDPVEHRARVEGRAGDIPGLELPTWRDVVEREYEPWDRDHLVVDTAAVTAAGCVELILRYVGRLPANRP